VASFVHPIDDRVVALDRGSVKTAQAKTTQAKTAQAKTTEAKTTQAKTNQMPRWSVTFCEARIQHAPAQNSFNQ
jgi:hypothetical protein